MPHNGFIYEAQMDMMENSGHCLMYCCCRHLRQSPGLWPPALLPWPHLLVSPCPSCTPAQGIIIIIIINIKTIIIIIIITVSGEC